MNAPEKQPAVEVEHTILRLDDWMFNDVLDMIADYYEESEIMQRFPYSEARVERMLAASLMSPQVLGAAAIDMRSKTINGILTASLGSVFWSDEPLVSDILLYVRPEFRGRGVVKPLLDYYERWAKRAGVKKLFFEQTSGVDAARTEKLFESLGWKYVGSKMFKEIHKEEKGT